MTWLKSLVVLLTATMSIPMSASASASSSAADKPESPVPPVSLEARAIGGAAVKVPEGNRPTVLIFAMGSQARSRECLEQAAPVIRAAGDVQVVVVISGRDAVNQGAKLIEGGCAWPVVADPDYAISAKLHVRVWPTTSVLRPDGAEAAHLPGLSKHYAAALEAYLAFAAGKIDQGALDKRLAGTGMGTGAVLDDASQIADRHLTVARRLVEKGLPEQARAELEAALKLHPDSPPLQLAMARLLVILGEPEAAAKLIESIDAAAVHPVHLNLLRGKVAASRGKWAEAAELFRASIRLNPEPAESWYELGVACEHLGEWAKAAEAYRKAFEATETGRKLRPAPARP